LTISRRSFLGAAALAAGTLTGCTTTTGAPRPTPTSSPSSSPAPVPPDWAALRGRLSGELVLPGEGGFPGAARVFNPLFDSRKPAAVASCTSPEDVAACVSVAAAARMPIAARSGGHSYAGYSNPNGALVVDLSAMSTVDFSPDGTAVVGAGTKLIDVYTALAAENRCLPAGSCPTVGVAGLTLGGGIGVLARKYGLTCDKLTSAEVVTAAGPLTASPSSEPDLFWALRGGGGGNFGIVTSLTFTTEAAPSLVVFSLRFDGGAGEVVDAWQSWLADAPDELWSNCVVSAGSPPSVRVGGCFVGSAAECSAELDRFGLSSSSRFVSSKGFLEAMRYFAGCSTSDCHASSRQAFVASSRILASPVGGSALVSLLDGLTGVDLLLDSLGGAVSAVGSTDTAFPHRTALASAQIYASGGSRAATQQVAEIRDGLGKVAGAHGYVNYIDPDMPDWAQAYYGPNLPRLRSVAEKYDPDGVFAFAQGLAGG